MIIYQNKYTEEIKKFVNAYAFDGDHIKLEPYLDMLSLKYKMFIHYDDMLEDVEIWLDKHQIYRSAYARYGYANYSIVPSDVYSFETLDTLISFLWEELLTS
jgi:hypothetical protein